MTETTETTPEPEQASQIPEAPEAPEADSADRPNREAARYRRQLRETEARAAALEERVQSLQRREVERLAAADLATPGDLWLTGTELGALLNEDGEVDPDKVKDTVAAVVADRPGWRRPVASFDGGVRESAPTSRVSWESLLRDHLGHRP